MGTYQVQTNLSVEIEYNNDTSDASFKVHLVNVHSHFVAVSMHDAAL